MGTSDPSSSGNPPRRIASRSRTWRLAKRFAEAATFVGMCPEPATSSDSTVPGDLPEVMGQPAHGVVAVAVPQADPLAGRQLLPSACGLSVVRDVPQAAPPCGDPGRRSAVESSRRLPLTVPLQPAAISDGSFQSNDPQQQRSGPAPAAVATSAMNAGTITRAPQATPLRRCFISPSPPRRCTRRSPRRR